MTIAYDILCCWEDHRWSRFFPAEPSAEPPSVNAEISSSFIFFLPPSLTLNYVGCRSSRWKKKAYELVLFSPVLPFNPPPSKRALRPWKIGNQILVIEALKQTSAQPPDLGTVVLGVLDCSRLCLGISVVISICRSASSNPPVQAVQWLTALCHQGLSRAPRPSCLNSSRNNMSQFLRMTRTPSG